MNIFSKKNKLKAQVVITNNCNTYIKLQYSKGNKMIF